MSIVITEVESVHGSQDQQRIVFYRCQDHLGVWHRYGPVITVDGAFDAQAYTGVVADRVAEQLAAAEAAAAIG